ncbi:MAG: tRNA (N(6)-L-threonylcarbamoyladenosine(37)-C(2))-methylthiotransferase [Methanoregula sp.]|nr:tRNA (N(6)-L-threonylcarbamoyladenosine(37)-C(2))-methylthiotransferase [Methanoregula sp.]
MLKRVAGIPEIRYGKNADIQIFETFRERNVYIETYGCRYNFGDTAKLIEILKSKGSTLVDSAEAADSVIINTCTVVGPTERRMLRRLSQLREYDLFVTGCMPEVQLEAIFAVCTPSFLPSRIIHEAYRSVRTVGGGGVAIVQIAQGCLGRCTYCLTRVARGHLKSFPEEDILTEIRAHSDKGTPEIQITAQDTSCWGLDIGKSLPDLLHRIEDLPGRFKIRVGMMNPATVTGILDDLVEAFAGDRIFKFVHLPVQSGSDEILKRMGRGYNVADFERIVTEFKKHYPEITVATDMIVGFPSETTEDFSDSLDLIERVRPNKVNITRYSQRPFTPLSSKEDYPEWVKKDRSRIMNSRSEKVYTSINSSWLGKQVPFLVTETIKNGSVMARSPNYLGIVINENLPVGFEGYTVLKNDRKYFFTGKLVR